uniref:Esterase n=1 Tax=Oryza punctata TaxID=4537 RepID=A0A0E0KLH4_ORYPU
MAAHRSVVVLLLIPLAVVAVPAAAAAAEASFETVYAFGDSFTDTGNTHSTTGPYSFGYVSSPPYGATFFHRSTNRYSDGRLVVDFLTDRLSLPGFLPPYLSPAAANATHGVNFAVAGATAIEHDFFAKNNLSVDITPQSIMTELAWFEAHLRRSPAAARAVGDALFWVGEIGANDYAYSFMAATTIHQDQIRTMAVDRVTTFIEGLPLTGCLPLTMTLARPEDRDNISCAATVNEQSHAHNRHLQASLRRLRQRHPAAVIAYADYYAAHLAVMTSPARYGFTEPFKTCCGAGGGAYNFEIFSTCGSPEVTTACAQPAKYVNWDGVHMTEAMYRVVAGMFFQDGRYCKPPFSTLLARRKKGH